MRSLLDPVEVDPERVEPPATGPSRLPETLEARRALTKHRSRVAAG
jgi:hypothetical protein